MAMRALQIRRTLISIGATDDQADEFAEAMDEFVTKDHLDRALREQDHRIMNRVMLFGMGLTSINIGATALLTQL